MSDSTNRRKPKRHRGGPAENNSLLAPSKIVLPSDKKAALNRHKKGPAGPFIDIQKWGLLKRLENGLSRTDFQLARSLYCQMGDGTVLDDHGVALRALTQTKARAVHF